MTEPKTRLITAWAIAFSFLLPLVLLSTLYAQKDRSQTAPPEGAVLSSKGLETVPSSRPKVTVRLTFDNGKTFTASQFEGEPIKISRNGSTFALVPHIDTQRNQVSATMLQVLSVAVQNVTVGQSIVEIGSCDIGREASELPNGELGVKIALVELTYEATPREGRNKISRYHLMDDFFLSQCCLTCSGVTVCSCAVEGDCGSCCTGSCCT